MGKFDPEAGHSAAGRSIREIVEFDLDEEMRILKDPTLLASMSDTDIAQAKGVAYGLARALASWLNPYDVDAALAIVRAEAVERWETAQAAAEAVESWEDEQAVRFPAEDAAEEDEDPELHDVTTP